MLHGNLTTRSVIRTIAGQDRTPTAAEIKKTVPELWVRKMKTFFALYDRNDDGIVTIEDYRMFEDRAVAIARADNVGGEQIKRFQTRMRDLWIRNIAGGEDVQLTENEFLEVMFEAVSRTGAEALFRDFAHGMFDLVDLNQDGVIGKEEDRAMRGGDPWSIVAFSSLDTNKDGEITREEFEQAYTWTSSSTLLTT